MRPFGTRMKIFTKLAGRFQSALYFNKAQSLVEETIVKTDLRVEFHSFS